MQKQHGFFGLPVTFRFPLGLPSRQVTTPCPDKKRLLVLPCEFANSKDVSMIFGTKVTKTTVNLIFKIFICYTYFSEKKLC